MLTLYNYASKHSGATVESFATQMETTERPKSVTIKKIAMSSIAHLIAQDDGFNTEQL